MAMMRMSYPMMTRMMMLILPTKAFETDESAATPPPHPAYRVTARISIRGEPPTLFWSDTEVARLLVIPTPPPSPLFPWSSSLPKIPSPLPPILSPLPVSSPPPASPTNPLGYKATMIRLRAKAPSTSHSPLPHIIIFHTKADTPPPGTPQLLPILLPTSSPPLHLLSTDRRVDRPEVTLPPWKRLGISLGPRYEVGESSSSPTARPPGGFRADYGFVATMDRDRRARARTSLLMEREARMSREAWGRSSSEAQFIEALKLLKRLQTQMTEFDSQQGPAKGPAQPDALEEAGINS
ncbi:hypothetical protein Tco_0355278 [Tanacetum coccineum]